MGRIYNMRLVVGIARVGLPAVLSAQALGRPDAEALAERVAVDICKLDEDLRTR